MRTFAFIYGIIFLVVGILGFTTNYGADYFHFNVWLNTLHLASGAAAFVLGFWSRFAARLYFQIIGIVYALLAILGFIYEEKNILGVFASSSANTWFHVLIAIAALILGYGSKD
ncbi:MAG: DUF4383 domain-containing protein [Chlamydiales bacterium]